jgi:glycosyltransferase involved in cell wall biosynthesis
VNKRIAHFVDTETPGGAEVLIVTLCEKLIERGYQPEILHFGQDFLSSKCERLKIPSVIVPHRELYKSIKTLPLFSWKFAKLLRQRNIALLHTHLFGPTTAGSLTGFFSRTPNVGTLHDTYIIEERVSRARLLSMTPLLNTRLVTVSEHMKKYFMEVGTFSADSLSTIPNGVSLPEISQSKRQEVRGRLGRSGEEFIFMCVGRLVELKRHGFLIEAFSKLIENQNATLMIVGDGPDRPALEDLVRRLSLEGRVLFLGFREDVADLLLAADCFALASRTEGLSYSIAEAMAAALPVVATNVGGNCELVVDGENGFLVDVDDLRGYSERLKRVLEDRELCRSFGRASRERAKRRFSLEGMVDGYLGIYRSLLKLEAQESIEKLDLPSPETVYTSTKAEAPKFRANEPN